jgi:hypothetical protein
MSSMGSFADRAFDPVTGSVPLNSTDPFAIGGAPTAWGELSVSAVLFAGLAMLLGATA